MLITFLKRLSKTIVNIYCIYTILEQLEMIDRYQVILKLKDSFIDQQLMEQSAKTKMKIGSRGLG